MIATLFSVVFLVAILMAAAAHISFAMPPDRRPRCRDCGAVTPGGRRCWVCANAHVDAVVHYGEFCRAWQRIGLEEYLRFRGMGHHMGVYR